MRALLFIILFITVFDVSGQQMHENSADPPSVKTAGDPVIEMNTGPAHAVRYDLYINDTLVNYTGKKRKGFAINGSIPAPTLYFTEGDTAEIYVHNLMKEETSLHWHGIILPNRFDGVPYLTGRAIAPGETYVFRFPLIQNGTYWYHSHTKLQEQNGMYGALIIYKKNEAPVKTYTMILSEWTDQRPAEVHRSLHNASDWYAIKKKSTQAYSEALLKGYMGQRLKSDWLRMTPMDVSDVYYNRFLLNGEPAVAVPALKKGDRVKLRIVNGGATSYFWLSFAGGKLTVIANDGKDVVPVEVDRMIIATAETYDVMVTIPEDNLSYEFLATPEDRTSHASLWLGSGEKRYAATLPKLNYFEGLKMMNGMMNLDGSMDDMGMQMSNQQMDMNTVMYPEITGKQEKKDTGHDMNNMPHNIVTLNYSMLRSPVETTLPDWPVKTLHFRLTGNMLRYLWTIDNKTISESDRILIRNGENVRIIIENQSMMRHPMHLHGHFFRVLNGQGDYAPLKNVLDIMPMETDTIEFAATESGDWFFHCHILYHMMSGMGRVFSYENSPPVDGLPDVAKAQRKFNRDDKAWHPMFHVGIETNGSDAEFMYSNKRNVVAAEWHIGVMLWKDYETEIHYSRYLDKQQFLKAYAGGDFRFREHMSERTEKNLFGQMDTKDQRNVACIGLQYTLPFFILTDLRLDHTGKIRFQLSREDIALTPRLRLMAMGNTDREYMAGLRYILTKYFSASTHYDSDMGWGIGITVTY